MKVKKLIELLQQEKPNTEASSNQDSWYDILYFSMVQGVSQLPEKTVILEQKEIPF